jgi:hypothetical protein
MRDIRGLLFLFRIFQYVFSYLFYVLICKYFSCFIYNEPSQEQLKATANLIKDIYARRGKLPIYGHRDFNATACPGSKFDLDKLKKLIEVREVQEYTDINAIAWELGHRGIISNNDLWINKADKDADIYWLMRKTVHYIRGRD